MNINIESGKLVALVGPSGSGKSTFLHLLALLDEPTQGKIFLFGNSITNISEDKKNKIIKDYISIIFQNNNLLSDFTALENVAIPLIIRNQNYIDNLEQLIMKTNVKHIAKIILDMKVTHWPYHMIINKRAGSIYTYETQKKSQCHAYTATCLHTHNLRVKL